MTKQRSKKPKMTPNHPHGPKNGSIHAIMGHKKRLKNVFRDKITAENAFSDLGAHTNVVRNALLLPMALVWSRLVDIDFGVILVILGHFGSFWVILGHSGSFWVILGSFWGHSGVILGSFWVHSGSILGSFTARNSLK